MSINLDGVRSEGALALIAGSLLGDTTMLTEEEASILAEASVNDHVHAADVKAVKAQIESGGDPLGEAFLRLRSAGDRRSDGAVYTPPEIVRSMTRWLSSQGNIERIIDPGAGSGRYVLAAAEAFPNARLIAVEKDPLAALLLRANLSVRIPDAMVEVVVGDFRDLSLPTVKGKTAFVGNPPYVRHHDIDDEWKRWYVDSFSSIGIKASALAGLHLHFYLKVFQASQDGDVGAFVTSAEWMDVNYGSALRALLVEKLGLESLHVLEPSLEAFPGTATTAAIACFHVGTRKRTIKSRSVSAIGQLNGLSRGQSNTKNEFRNSSKWSSILAPITQEQDGLIELGEFFRVHRGQVTGKNEVWVASAQAHNLPERVLFPSVTKARDIISAGSRLNELAALRNVIDLPTDLDDFTLSEKKRIQRFLQWAKSVGADSTYIATHRKAWWSVGLKQPAPILCTYMARRPPQFTVNMCQARHINIAHGLYPREDIDQTTLAAVVDWLNQNVNVGSGRTYAGGLTKFEPKEIERLKIPSPERIIM
ncbi:MULTISPECIES: Eco57I restriction-modification methylase domain-containing protein [Spongiibacter]|jgi:predicted RNA methylase|uniref:Eco57I restriction-modification methylase domain-containing protein n=3 Tax=Spongiibacteraceae TaxID=1706375 RepID=UPI000C5F08B1|nr:MULTISPECIES: N-6 DNA methylase [Spongiibacter]MAY38364.1 SAM-dependent methyltransferase [Spongiibacter sp.]MBI59049.1 SAM-dependent methyltransferase [Spongiibacter sp.]